MTSITTLFSRHEKELNLRFHRFVGLSLKKAVVVALANNVMFQLCHAFILARFLELSKHNHDLKRRKNQHDITYVELPTISSRKLQNEQFTYRFYLFSVHSFT